MTKYVVVGAGVIGLYTTFSLLEKGVQGNEITVLAEYLPGDESINYTSPYAGGNFSCITGDDPETLEFDKYTYTNLHKVQKPLAVKLKVWIDIHLQNIGIKLHLKLKFNHCLVI